MSGDPEEIRKRALRELDRQQREDNRRLYRRLAFYALLLAAIIAAWIILTR